MRYLTPVCPPDFEVLSLAVHRLKKAYPAVALGVYGKSELGRELYMLNIGPAKNAALIAAGFHAQEWIGVLVALHFAERLCRAVYGKEELCGIDAAGALWRRGVIIIPCVNPDGVEIALRGAKSAGKYAELVERAQGAGLWNANARGVDINHNFDAGWELSRELEREAGIDSPAPSRYGGERPESERESFALCALCRRRVPRQVMALHSQGEEIFCEYGERTPPRSLTLGKILAASSGYDLVQNSGLCSHAGFKDWFMEAFARPGFTVELGRGKNPLPLSDFAGIYRKTEEALMLFSAL